MPPANRILYLDALRVIAIFGVVLLHMAGWPTSQGNPHTVGWWFANLYNGGARFSVPVFVMASGALLLDPSRADAPGVFFRRRLTKVVIPFLVWVNVYYIRGLIQTGDPFQASGWLREVLRGASTEHLPAHLWFLPMIIGLYLATPFIKPFTDRAGNRQLVLFVLLCAMTASIYPFLLRFADMKVSITNGLFNTFLGYFVLGTLLHRIPLPNRRAARLLWLPLLILSVTATTAGTGWLTLKAGKFDNWFYHYHSPGVVLTAVCVFMVCRHLFETEPPAPQSVAKVVNVLAPLSFGIYLVHILVMAYAQPVTRLVGFAPTAIALPIKALMVFAVSALIVRVLRAIPVVRNAVP